MQAVHHLPSDTFGAVFYQAATAGDLRAEAPAVVLIRNVGGKTKITVNDPEQNPARTSIRLFWKGKKYEIRLPGGEDCGKPVTVTIH